MLNRCDFRSVLKVENVQDRHRSTGRLFQAHGPATARARSPMVERRVAGTRTLAVDAESSQRRECMPSLLLQDLQNANTQIRRVSGNDFVPAGQCAGTPRRACATVKPWRLNCCVKKRLTFLRPTCGLQTAQISV